MASAAEASSHRRRFRRSAVSTVTPGRGTWSSFNLCRSSIPSPITKAPSLLFAISGAPGCPVPHQLIAPFPSSSRNPPTPTPPGPPLNARLGAFFFHVLSGAESSLSFLPQDPFAVLCGLLAPVQATPVSLAHCCDPATSALTCVKPAFTPAPPSPLFQLSPESG